MADNVQAGAAVGSGVTFATDADDSGSPSVHYPINKLAFGALNTFTLVTGTVGLPVGDAGGSLTVDAPVATPVFVRLSDGAAAIAALPVTDNAGSLTVDAPVGTPVFVRLSDGTAAITTLAVSLASVPSHAVTNTGVFAVQVDGAGLTALQLIDDAVHADDAVRGKSLLMGAVLDDTAPLVITENQAGYLRMSSRRALLVEGVASGTALTVGSHDVTNAGTFAVQAAQSGTWNIGTVTTVTAVTTVTTVSTVTTVTNVATIGTSVTPGTSAAHLGKAEDAAHVTGDTGVFVLAVRSDVAASTAGTDGDYVALIVDSTGRLHCNVSNTLTVASHAVTNAGTFPVQVDGAALTALQLIDDAVAGAGFNVSQMNGIAVTMGNGAAGTGVQRVTIASDSTGVLAGVTTVTTVTTCSTVTTLTGSGVAHDAVDSGNPHKIGAKATASLLGGTPVAAADRSDLFCGTDGALITRPNTSLEDIISEQKTNTDGAATAMTVAFAATASQRIYLTDLILANSSATNITVDIRDGAAGAVLATFPVPANGGVVHRFGVPLRFSANTAAAFDGSAAVTTLSVTMLGFKSKT